MRQLPLVLAISAVVHTGAIAWVSAYTQGQRVELAPDPSPTTVEIIEAPKPPPMPEVAPVDVAFLDEQTTAAVPVLPAPARSRTRGDDARIASSAGPPGQPEVAAATGPIVRNPYMDMRRGNIPKVALPKFEWTPDMAPGTPPPPDEVSGELSPDGGGRYRSDQGPFVAKVDRDGGVTLKDKRNFSIHIALPSPKDLGRLIGDWYLDPNKPVGTLPPETIQRAPVLNNDESSGADKKPDHGDVATIPIVAGGFDITDAFMRGHGNDPYASKKLKFLDATRAERVQIGMRHRSEQLAMAPAIMKKNLERLWATIPDPAARRELLFELWDEVEESGSEELVSAGTEARQFVIGWIRAKLPAGSSLAYTAEGLAALNKRRTSKAEFAPY